nr:CMF_HP1_G0046320.mRNA.1.CDS.1 [Saccharomyces cerevisiae]
MISVIEDNFEDNRDNTNSFETTTEAHNGSSIDVVSIEIKNVLDRLGFSDAPIEKGHRPSLDNFPKSREFY